MKRLVAWAQIIMAVVFIGGYFLCLWDFIHGKISTPPEWKDTVQALISLLTAGVLQILHYFFQRQREPDDPKDPQ